MRFMQDSCGLALGRQPITSLTSYTLATRAEQASSDKMMTPTRYVFLVVLVVVSISHIFSARLLELTLQFLDQVGIFEPDTRLLSILSPLACTIFSVSLAKTTAGPLRGAISPNGG